MNPSNSLYRKAVTPLMRVNQYIEHTLLKADACVTDIERIAQEAIQNEFLGICINSCFVERAKKLLSAAPVKLVTVVGFPLGANHFLAKAYEADVAVQSGADEIDMVINVGALKDSENSLVERDITAVVKAASSKIVKVIIETGFLNDEQKKRACQISVAAGAQFVKTCTGFGPGVAEVHDVQLMKATVGPAVGVKASAGIKTLPQALALIEAGASRIGTSSGIAIIAGHKGSCDY